MIDSLEEFRSSVTRMLAVATAGVLLAAGLTVVDAPAPAAAAAPLACINTLYFSSNTAGNVGQVDLATGAVSPTPVFTTPADAGTSTNQLGIGAKGALAMTGTSTSVVRYTPEASQAGTTVVTAKPAGVAAGTMGAINPLTGLYYFGAYTGSTANFFVSDPATGNPPVGPVVSVTVTNPPGANGDIAFDKTGRLYLVAGGATEAALYVADGVIPTSGTGTTLTSRELSRGVTTAATNGIAFGSDGFLYLGSSTVLQKTNPITGAPTGTSFTLTGVTSTDLGTCANPSTAVVAGGFDGPRDQPTDQVRVVLEGGSYGPDGTTPDFPPSASGPNGAGVPSEPGLILPGETYTIRQDPVGTTSLGEYTTTWSCTDATGAVIARGVGSTGTFTAPVGTDGVNIDCAFVNVLPPPVAVSDSGVAPFGRPVDLPGATNDQPGNGAILPDRTTFTDPSATDGGTRLDAPEGIWTVGNDGRIVFTPAPGFSGTATAEYRVVDDNGLISRAATTATIRPGPTANPDSASTPQNVNVSFPVLANDVPGMTPDGSAGAFDPDSFRFEDTPGLPPGSVVSAAGLVLTAPGEGDYTFDPSTREVFFEPAPRFTGTATPVTYTVDDSFGNPASTTVAVTVTPIVPVAADDVAKTPGATPVVIDILANDRPGAASTPLVPASVVFTAPGAVDGGTTLLVPGEGAWTVRSDGTVRFAPLPSFSGMTTPVGYTVADADGTVAPAAITVTVGSGAIAAPDAATTPQNTPVTLDVLDNDLASDLGNPCDAGQTNVPAGCDTGELVPASVVFPTVGQPAGAVVSNGGRTIDIPGQGVSTIGPDGRVTFTPAPAFRGVATPIAYAVTDSLGNAAASTLTITVAGVDPIARDDSATTAAGAPVAIDVLGDDSPGTNGAALDPASLRIVGAGGALVTELTVPGEGVWNVVDGKIVFTPESGFSGRTAPITYSVADLNGTRVTAIVTVTVTAGAVALPTTGGEVPWVPFGVGLLLLLAGIVTLLQRRSTRP